MSGINIDLKEAEESMLKVIYDRGGETNTSEIKKETGLSNQQIHYRYDKLEDMGLIVTREGETKTNRIPPTVAELTERCEEAIREGLIGDVFQSNVPDSVEVSRENFEEYQKSLDRLEVRLNAIRDEVQDISEEVDSGGSQSGGFDGKEMRAIKSRFDELSDELEEVSETAEKALDETQGFKKQFNERFLPYFRAMRTAMKEELDVDVDAYYKEQKKG